MKEIYSFEAKRTIKKPETYLVKDKKTGEEKEKTRTKKVVEKSELALIKPTANEAEEGEFFFGQQFNKFVQSGFLTKAMMQKKFESIGGLEESDKNIKEFWTTYLQALKVIEFYEGQEDLTEDKKSQLDKARVDMAEAQKYLVEFNGNIQAQFSQTADVKAEQKLIEWLMLHFLYSKEHKEGGTEYFPFFEGSSYEEKRAYYLLLQEDVEESDALLFKKREILEEKFNEIIRVITIWNSGQGKTPEQIKEKLKELFDE